MTIDDTYEAAYYIISGARLVSVDGREPTPQEKKRRKVKYIWLFELEGVPEWAVTKWRTHEAVGNIRDFRNVRMKLKAKAHKRVI